MVKWVFYESKWVGICEGGGKGMGEGEWNGKERKKRGLSLQCYLPK